LIGERLPRFNVSLNTSRVKAGEITAGGKFFHHSGVLLPRANLIRPNIRGLE